jgi:hypothetical protein
VIVALAIVSVLLAISVALNFFFGLALRDVATGAAYAKSAEQLARAAGHARSPSGKLWPPTRGGS